MRNREELRYLVPALSLANLTFLKVWTQLLAHGPEATYFRKSEIEANSYWGALAGLAIVTGLVYALLWMARHATALGIRVASRMTFVLCLALPLNGLRTLLADQFPALRPYLRYELFRTIPPAYFWLVFGLLALMALAALLYWQRPVLRLALTGLTLCSPFCAVTVPGAIWYAAQSWPLAAEASTVPAWPERVSQAPPEGTAKPPRHRFIVALFDELDYRLTFVDRPRGLRLPEFDRLRSESIFATQAYSPSDNTLTAIPGITTGRVVMHAAPVTDSDLALSWRGGGRRWSQGSNVFRLTRAAGARNGIVGWYHPYCRVFADSADTCAWWPSFTHDIHAGAGAVEMAGIHLRSVLEAASLSPFGFSLYAAQHVKTYRENAAAAEWMAADSSLDFVFIHFPVPHAPFVYRRDRGTFDLKNSPVSGYADALALADLTLGRMRTAMERSGVWNNTTVLVTADHSFRTASAFDGRQDARVPFVLKLAGSRTSSGSEYREILHTTELPRLAPELLSGAIHDVQTFSEARERWTRSQ